MQVQIDLGTIRVAHGADVTINRLPLIKIW